MQGTRLLLKLNVGTFLNQYNPLCLVCYPSEMRRAQRIITSRRYEIPTAPLSRAPSATGQWQHRHAPRCNGTRRRPLVARGVGAGPAPPGYGGITPPSHGLAQSRHSDSMDPTCATDGYGSACPWIASAVACRGQAHGQTLPSRVRDGPVTPGEHVCSGWPLEAGPAP